MTLTTYTQRYHIEHGCVRLKVSFDSKFKKMFIVPDWLISSEFIDRKTRSEIYYTQNQNQANNLVKREWTHSLKFWNDINKNHIIAFL